MEEIIMIGEYTADFSRQKIYKDGQEIPLPTKIKGAKAWKFFQFLVEAGGTIQSYAVLDESGIWQDDRGMGVDHRASMKNWVSAFNKVFDRKVIKNKSGVGYYFDGKLEVAEKEWCALLRKDTPVSQNQLIEEIYVLSGQLDALVEELETIQKKLEEKRALRNWEQIYETQFEAVYFKLTRVRDALEEKREQIKKLEELRQNQCNAETPDGGNRLHYGFDFGNYYSSSHFTLEEDIKALQAQVKALNVTLDEITDDWRF